NELFVTKIILPERLRIWLSNDSIVGDTATSRSEAQALAAFKAFKMIIDLELVDDNLLIVENLRSEPLIDPESGSSNEVGSPKEEAFSEFGTFVDDVHLNSPFKDALNIQEVIPQALIYDSPFEQKLYLYGLEYEAKGKSCPIIDLNLPSWS